METNILMESGTNEVEILEFIIGGNHYGINVAKIREIVPYEAVTPIPVAKPEVEGIFMPRDTMITVIDLTKVLKLQPSANVKSDMFIITNFNKLNVAFHVHQVIGIHRVSWADIITPDTTISSSDQGIATGIIKLEDKLVVILDFEKIVADISPETGLKVSEVDKFSHRGRNDSPIVIAEDSPLLIRLISDSLHKSGYTNLTLCKNGQEAWDALCHYKSVGDIDRYVACVITDLEMPMMDGHRLTKLIKSDNELKHIPVIIFSSLINEQMKVKGESLGADAQLSKPEIGLLVSEIDRLLMVQGE